MREFELESLAEAIHFGKTKSYFSEVIISYQNRCYRSAVVMLWSVVICDLVYKLQSLVDKHNDSIAKEILDEVKRSQITDPKSSSWEIQILDNVMRKTNLIDTAEYENLRFLQIQRHLSAHPVLKENLELHTPNKETVRALIRNTLEGVLNKPPFYTQKVTSEFLEDIEEAKDALNTFRKLKTYIESRYLSRLTTELELSLFKTLWKLTFKLENDKCERNRTINFWSIRVLAGRNKHKIASLVTGEPDYFNNISPTGNPAESFCYFLSLHPDIYPLLSTDSKLKVQHTVENTHYGKIHGWFIHRDLNIHYKNLNDWIVSDEYPYISHEEWVFLFNLSDSEEWEQQCCILVSLYYCKSGNFNSADARYSEAIIPFLKYFKSQSAIYLLEQIEGNSQVYNRSRARLDHPQIRLYFDKILPDNYDYSLHYNFDRTSQPSD